MGPYAGSGRGRGQSGGSGPSGGNGPSGARGQSGGRGRGRRGDGAARPTGASASDIHFINAFTDTVDLSALRRRLEMEDAGSTPEATEYIPRLYSRKRPAADAASTQVVRRPGAAGGGWDTRSGDLARPGPAGPGDPDAGAGAAGAERVRSPRRHRAGAAGAARGEDGPPSAALAEGPGPGGEPIEGQPGQQAAPGSGSTKSKAIWTLADQGVSSATNAAVSFLIARQVSTSEYGAFAVSYIIFSVIIGLSRAGCCLPLGIAYSGRSVSDFRYAAASATGTCLAAGAVLGVVLAGAGALLGGSVGAGLVVMGFVLPGLLVQDAWRYVFFAQGRPFGAFLNDIAWAAVQMIGVTVLIERGVKAAPPMLLAWGVSALIAALLGVAQAGLWPAPSRALTWIRENRANAMNLSAEFVTVQGALQASILLIGVLGSKEMVGSLQGVRTLLAPTTVVGMGIVSFAVPELSRRSAMSARSREQAAVLLTAIVVGLGGLWSLIFLLFPRIGEALLGDTWPGVHAILLLSVLHYAGTAVPTGPACIMYALGHTRTTFRINLVMAPMLFAFPLVGVLIGGAQGAVVGFNIVFWGIAPVWWIVLRRVVREHEAKRLQALAAADHAGTARRGGRQAGRQRDDGRWGSDGTRDPEPPAGTEDLVGAGSPTSTEGLLGTDSAGHGDLAMGAGTSGQHRAGRNVRLMQGPEQDRPDAGGRTSAMMRTPPPAGGGSATSTGSGPQRSTDGRTESGNLPER
ncbi:teichoic acid transporter [Parafrankia sp. FMc2]|uniref:teichoic acid transporter n=1 Tax=Parafrankia sp. FMc2 TaxID=3233196 RepID=UPI0034D46084